MCVNILKKKILVFVVNRNIDLWPLKICSNYSASNKKIQVNAHQKIQNKHNINL